MDYLLDEMDSYVKEKIIATILHFQVGMNAEGRSKSQELGQQETVVPNKI